MNTVKTPYFARRRVLRAAAFGGLGAAGLAALAGCGETQIVEKEVVKVVTQQVPVEKIVTKEVIKEVPVEKIVTKEVEKVVEKIVTQVVQATPAKPKEITIASWWYPIWSGVTGEEPADQKPGSLDYPNWVAKQFKEVMPNVTIKFEEVTWDEGRQKINVAVASGTGPNFFHEDEAEVKKFVLWDVLEPVDNYLTKEDTDDFLPSSLEAATMRGKKWFFPWIIWATTMAFNTAVTDKFGVTNKLPTGQRQWTWDQFLELAQATTGQKDGKQQYAWTAQFGQNSGDYYRYEFLWNQGARLFGDDYNTVTLNSDAGVRGLQFLTDLQNKYQVMPPGSANFKSADVSKLWWAGELAVSNQGNGVAFTQRKMLKDGALKPGVVNLYPVLNPSLPGKKPLHYVGNWALSVFGKKAGKKDDEIEASMAFAHYYTGPVLARRPNPFLYYPTRKSAGNLYKGDDYLEFMNATLPLQGKDAIFPWYYSMRQFFVPMFQQALSKQGEPKALLDDATKRANEWIKTELKKLGL